MAQSLGLSLAHMHDGHIFRADSLDLIEQFAFDPGFKGCLQFERGIEVVLDGVFGGVSYQDNFLDPRRHTLIDHILDEWFVDNG
ncbi:hypothetical protein D3C84_874960 [compost metagenome]